MGVQLFGSPLGWDLYGWKLGAGPQFSFKTRTDKDLKGAGNGAGLSGVVAGGHGDFSFAALIGHLWGFDGDFSTTAVQPMIYYNFPALPGAYLKITSQSAPKITRFGRPVATWNSWVAWSRFAAV